MSPGPGDLAKFAPLGAMFLGAKAKTAMPDVLEYAQAMEKAGKSADEIWQTTAKLGQPWFKGADGKWRFEIDDSKSRLGDKALAELMAGPAGASGATQRSAPGTIWHDDLYKAYPELRTIDIDARYNTALSNPNGSFVAGAQYNGGRPRIDIQANSLEGDRNSVRGIGLHEMQHGVQSIEGFVDGANDTFGHKKDDVWHAAKSAYEDSVGLGADGVSEDEILAELLGRPFEKKPAKSWDDLTEREKVAWLERGRGRLYSRNAGEVEARNVQSRMNLTMDERIALPPWATQDVPTEQQIVRFGDGPAMAIEDFAARRAGKAKPYREAMGMDEASRMKRAQEMGFDVDNPVYHGTRTKGDAIDAFDLEKAGSKTDAGYMGKGIYFGNDKTANVYAGHYEFDPGHFPEGGAVYPSYLALKSPLRLDDKIENGRSVDLELLARDALGLPREATAEQVTQEALRQGYDGAIYSRGAGKYQEYVVYQPEKIRSKFAAFDPAKKDSSNLLAGAAATALGLGLARQQLNEEQRNGM